MPTLVAPLLLFGSMNAPALAAPPANAAHPALPGEVRAVLEAAIASGEATAVETVARFAKQAHPAAEAEIRQLQDSFAAAAAARKEREAQQQRALLARATIAQHWDGNFEVGASRSTGSANSLGFFGAISAERDVLAWTHRVTARAEVQETNGARTAERIAAEWQPRRSLGGRAYGFGIAQYERDPFLGFTGRYTIGGGAGYSLLRGSDLRLDLEGGPSFRRTESNGAPSSSNLAGRASLDLSWRLSPTLEIKQNGAFYLEGDTGSGRATTAIDAVLIEPLRVRLSYELRYERDLAQGASSLDTGSRATLVFGF